MIDEAIEKAEILIEAFPYIKKFWGKIIVIKFGGSALGKKKIVTNVLQDIVFMSYAGMRPVLVHGGGPRISRYMKRHSKIPRFVNGHRVTDKETVQLVDRVLTGVNRCLVSGIKRLGGKAYGLSGRDSGLITAKKRVHKNIDIGFVGEIANVDTTLLERLLEANIIPVVSPVGRSRSGDLYNINADHTASRIAISLRAEKIAILTNVSGVLRNPKAPSSLIHTLTVKEARRMIKKSIVTEGMIPKLNACIDSVRKYVKKAHIVSAYLPHSLLLEIFTDKGTGTEIVR